jgi:hypothetical protein
VVLQHHQQLRTLARAHAKVALAWLKGVLQTVLLYPHVAQVMTSLVVWHSRAALPWAD